jgi:hypothetical protein
VVKVHDVDSEQQKDGADSSTGDAGKKQAVGTAGAGDNFSFEIVVHDEDSDEEEAVSDVSSQVGEGRAGQNGNATKEQTKLEKKHKGAPQRHLTDEWNTERKSWWLDHGSIETRLKTKSRLVRERNDALQRVKQAQQESEQERSLQERKALGPIDPEKVTKLAHMNKQGTQTPAEARQDDLDEETKVDNTSGDEGDCEVEVVVEQAPTAVVPTTASMEKRVTEKKGSSANFSDFQDHDDWVQAVVNNESLITQVQEYLPKATAKDALRLLRIVKVYCDTGANYSIEHMSALAEVTGGGVTWLRGRITHSKAFYIVRLLWLSKGGRLADEYLWHADRGLLPKLQKIPEV